MASLLSAVSAEFSTDFGILSAAQSGCGGAGAGGFVGSLPGCVAGLCGTKYADVLVRAERWDARPPQQLGWEDGDELPLEVLPGAGSLVLGGFDQTDVGLDVDGLGRARVLVFARGRQRYGHSDFQEGMSPEEWLLQVFPDPDAQDALAGDPRRLAGQAPFGPLPKTGWFAARHAWAQTGWHDYLYTMPGFYGVDIALSSAGHPLSRLELAAKAVPLHNGQTYFQGTPHQDPLAQPLQPTLTPEQQNPMRLESVRTNAQRLADLAAQVGLPEITVMGHFIQALENLGLLLVMRRKGEDLLVPNPCPGMVWDVLDIPEQVRDRIRVQIGYADFRQVAEDLDNIVGWARDLTLTTTPRTLATRLAVTVDEVRGGLDLLALNKRASHLPLLQDGNDDLDQGDVVLVIRRGGAGT